VVCARNYMLDHDRYLHARKRRPSGGIVSLEALRASDGEPFEPTVYDDPDRAFHDVWRKDLLERALREVLARCEREGKRIDYDVFVGSYMEPGETRPTWKQIAERFHLRDWKEASHRAERVKGRLARAIRLEVRRLVESEDDVDQEIRGLFE
jgi:hypothetical protein